MTDSDLIYNDVHVTDSHYTTTYAYNTQHKIINYNPPSLVYNTAHIIDDTKQTITKCTVPRTFVVGVSLYLISSQWEANPQIQSVLSPHQVCLVLAHLVLLPLARQLAPESQCQLQFLVME